MRKRWWGERGYLAYEDLWIKSKFPRSNLSIQEIGRVRKSKNPRGRRNKWKPQPRKLGRGFWIQARHQDPWLRARSQDLCLRARRQDLWLRGSGHVSATSVDLLCAARHLGAIGSGTETCYLRTICSSADLQVQRSVYVVEGGQT
jgi:hypothetical protein